ncbi:MAG TPA: hypothetical protein VK004_05005 [Ignavibacteria bacterium]|nr:hypothetical protein [Ignavibacteria bacterium]
MKRPEQKYFILFILILSGALYSCENIFSPKIDNTTASSILTDQKTVEGLFKNFQYAYTFKDTLVYGELLDETFIFTYRDYETGFDVSWDRPTEMRTTNGLFNNTQRLEVIWNNIIYEAGDSVNYVVKRGFNLTVTFNPNDIISLAGFADFTLARPSPNDKWKIVKWRDESF